VYGAALIYIFMTSVKIIVIICIISGKTSFKINYKMKLLLNNRMFIGMKSIKAKIPSVLFTIKNK
jgi:hypothetical protein